VEYRAVRRDAPNGPSSEPPQHVGLAILRQRSTRQCVLRSAIAAGAVAHAACAPAEAAGGHPDGRDMTYSPSTFGGEGGRPGSADLRE
jgi:hypothetical protein